MTCKRFNVPMIHHSIPANCDSMELISLLTTRYAREARPPGRAAGGNPGEGREVAGGQGVNGNGLVAGGGRDEW
eukprot:CAMPEP_0116827928 /NCGR_PEP_ID=MMETSP0418-20121206/3375_1 /TAXON_ID=1158023 /ORGANISM="Astrosyne radiata, Strain 13vi08-1A" /LENGTH=73 /DNA_ID=CAMNT_0004456765 /DNA_START=3851 /DNA_END=4069 /DNA_ORIENTATION=+